MAAAALSGLAQGLVVRVIKCARAAVAVAATKDKEHAQMKASIKRRG